MQTNNTHIIERLALSIAILNDHTTKDSKGHYTSAMTTPTYQELYERACSRKGGKSALESLLPKTASTPYLKKLSSDRYLAEFTRKIFQSGFVWRVVDKKWDKFEEIFWEFNIDKLLMMPDEMLERKATDKAIIRNLSKVKTIRDNALMIREAERREHRPFGEFIADWPKEDITGLWRYLKKHGSRLGGNTGPYALRALGVDTFLLTQDVEGFLRHHGIVDSGITTARALNAAQSFFNELHQESGRSLAQLSRLVSFCHGQNRER